MRVWEGIVVLALVACAVAPSESRAGSGFRIATVEYVRVYDTSVGGLAPPRFGFTLTGVTSAAGCPIWNGRILFIGNSKEALFVVMTAQLTGREVAVYFDDTSQVSGCCIARVVTTGSPPPEF
jgi:hypothetical protein